MSSPSPKLIELICEGLSLGIPASDTSQASKQTQRRQNRTTLARLACVSRAFSSHALDVLWRCVDEAHHLLWPLEAYDRDTYMFTDAVSEVQWKRLQEYARRVRTLHMGYFVDSIQPAVWVLLTSHAAQKPLLPKLEQLLGFVISSSSACCTALFSPTIRTLELRLPDRGAEPKASTVRFVIQAAQPALASVRDLSFNLPHSQFVDTQPVRFWTMKQLRRLEVLHDVALSADIVQSLADLPDLQRLSLKIREIPEDARASGFVALRELTVAGPLEHICAFITGAASQGLETLTIQASQLCNTDRASDNPLADAFLQPTFAKFTHAGAKLRRIHATFHCENCRTVIGHFDGRQTVLLEALRAISGLAHITLAFDGTQFVLRDEDLGALAGAWRALAAFAVTVRLPPAHDDTPYYSVFSKYEGVLPDPHRPRPSVPTFKTLAAFAQAHRGLRRLAVPSLDLYAVPDLATVPPLEHPLEHFEISKLAGKQPLGNFALAVDMLFPGLDLEEARTTRPSRRNRNGELMLLLCMIQEGRSGRVRKQAAAAQGTRRAVADIQLTFVARPHPNEPPSPMAYPHEYDYAYD